MSPTRRSRRAPALSRAFGVAAAEPAETEARRDLHGPRAADIEPGPDAVARDAGVTGSHRPVRRVVDPNEIRARLRGREVEARSADLGQAVVLSGRHGGIPGGRSEAHGAVDPEQAPVLVRPHLV